MEAKLIVIPLLVLVFMMYVIYQMVTSGKAHRKGAKKLRKKLFPFFYGKSNIFKKEVEVDA